MFCFFIFTVLYFLIASVVLVFIESRLKHRFRDLDIAKARSLDRAISATNLSNAVVATILSSISLYILDDQQRTNMYLRRPGTIAQWTIESVCGYITVEFTFILLNSFRLSRKTWKQLTAGLQDSLTFHTVALVGLLSVLIFDVGYAVALWVIWSELTSVFLGIESWMEETRLNVWYMRLFRLVKACSTMTFILQRVMVFFVLLWLCWQQFTWGLLYVAQLSVLCLGTILNVKLAIERVTDHWYIVDTHKLHIQHVHVAS